jgi:2,3-bisphosphoglycerate-dependent phosphoglycerate mutase
MMKQIILLRHGQSAWNEANQFTGWTDVDLTEKGIEEARQAGRFLQQAGLQYDIAFTSFLKRAIRSLWIVLDQMDRLWIPVVKDWRLNERHYGALQGENKTWAAEVYGRDQVFQWRRSYETRPPLISPSDERHPRNDPRYAGAAPGSLPGGESLKDTLERVLLCWNDLIVPELNAEKKVLIAAHGNTLRALCKHLDRVADQEVAGLSIPTAIPIVYELDEALNPVRKTYAGDAETVKLAVEAAARAAQVRADGK